MRYAPVEDGDPRSVIRSTEPVPLPPRATQLCRVCGSVLSTVLQEQNIDVHPNCEDAKLRFNRTVPEDPSLTHPKRKELMRMIQFAGRNSARSGQVAIGPSEIGGNCERRLAYRLAATKSVNDTVDQWPSIQGTAIHDWFKSCMDRDNEFRIAAGQPPRWITEKRVQVDPIIHGTSDLYDADDGTVVDWKSMGDAAEKKLAANGPSWGYFVQVQTYGLGFSRAGFKVRKVALMFVKRGGRLSDSRYYEWPFDPAVAQAAVERVYRIGRNVLALQKESNGADFWSRIPPDPGELCGWCPFFTRSVNEACAKGCPGH